MDAVLAHLQHFLDSVLAYFIKPPHHRERTSWYTPHFDKLNINGIVFPMHIKDIPKFEKQNAKHVNRNLPHNININVFELVDNTLVIKYINQNYFEPQIDLLLIDQVEENHI